MGFRMDGSLHRDNVSRRRAFSSGCLAGLGRLSPSDDCDRDLPEAGRGERPFLEDNLSLSRTSFVRAVNKEDWDRMALRTVGAARRFAVPEKDSRQLKWTTAFMKGCCLALILFSLIAVSGIVFQWRPPKGHMVPTSDPWLGCKEVQTMANFQLQRFNGEWHVVAWVPASSAASSARADKCMSATFSAENPAQAKVNFSCMVLPPKGTFWEQSLGSDGFSFHAGTAHSPDRGQPAKLQINLFASPKLSLWVLDTDYTTYALLYSCSLKLGGMTSDQAFLVMGRNHSMGPMDIGDRLNYLQQQGLPWKNVAFTPVPECRSHL